MPRNLVICFDGTSNEFGSKNTNVVRLVQMLDRDPAVQRLRYDPGVGTLPEPGLLTAFGKKVSEIGGLAFGWGLLAKVASAYQYLMQMWEPGDRVFLFGFSRGAYTARVLAGLLHELGLLPRGNDNLVPYAMRLFKTGRSKAERSESVATTKYWRLRDQFRETFARPQVVGALERRFRVHFLGVWDTVSSVGWAWDPQSFPYTARNPSIRAVRHAVAIDERRAFFRQNLMFPVTGQDFKQHWFPGVHCDIGGGYPENDGQLWRVALEWMEQEAVAHGLMIDGKRRSQVLPPLPATVLPWNEPTHESLTWYWWPAEFYPKLRRLKGLRWKVPHLGVGQRRCNHNGELLDRATVLRIQQSDYRPSNMSSEFLDRIRQLQPVPESVPVQLSPCGDSTLNQVVNQVHRSS